MSWTTRCIRPFLTVAAGAIVFVSAAAAQSDFPTRPVRLIIPYAAGGPTDILGRVVAQKLGEQLGQSVVSENRPGAAGIIGTDQVAKAVSDGYTLLFTAMGTLVMNPLLYSKLPYDTKRDFEPVSSIASYSMFLAVNPKLPIANIPELIAFAKKNPEKLTFGSAGNGTSNHLAAELLKYLAGIEAVHIPYKGNAAALLDVVTGQISFMFDLPANTLPQSKAGKIRLIGTTGNQRSPLAPEVPTIAEGGLPEYNVTAWFGVFAPAGTPKPIIQQINRAIRQALAAPEVKDKLLAQGYEVAASTPEQLAEMIKTETSLWSAVIKKAGIKLD
jgi:tripartite-type tricarboxylate transporter receptor subunit TctC